MGSACFAKNVKKPSKIPQIAPLSFYNSSTSNENPLLLESFRFCVGDRFFLCDNKILCEYDYEERMVFANLAYNSSNLAHIKQQAARAGKVSTHYRVVVYWF